MFGSVELVFKKPNVTVCIDVWIIKQVLITADKLKQEHEMVMQTLNKTKNEAKANRVVCIGTYLILEYMIL